MASNGSFKSITQKLIGVISIDNEAVEDLRKILEEERQQPITHEQAKEVGESLITVFKVLAGDREVLGVAKPEGENDE